ncbi:FAD-dependent oxidoreductase [Silvibacterium bohemicum]|uniref:FAD-dependent oxidoreductase n=1 Tax=Silvibacterium bohemicum TaxID=1577686 RepID=UPI000678CB17|nr:FAD-dependent monooxygenase [Silvibacterium bohemicum]
MIQTDVLIIGSGPAGLTAALALSTYGINNLVVTKYRWLADTPRAHVTNQRTIEVLRDFGLEAEALSQATPMKDLPSLVFCSSLAGEEFGRLHGFGAHPSRRSEYVATSPCELMDLPQNLLEPILVKAAAARGTDIRFGTEYVSHVQDESGVTATVRDRLSGESYEIRAQYLIGADGGRSKVAEDIALPMEGTMGNAGSYNIVFHADLTKYAAHRPGLLYFILQSGLEKDGLGIGLIRLVRRWYEWMLVSGYDLNGPAPDLSEAEAIRLVRKMVGDPELAVKITSTSLWTVNNQYATSYRDRRVFCMGDAVHRHPPNNGLGSNTSMQDAYNLSWKLAFLIQGKSGAGLLDSYSAERAPVGKQVVLRANKSIESYLPVFETIGLLAPGNAAQKQSAIDARKAATSDGLAQREQIRVAVANKTHEYNAHGVEMGQFYSSSAVVSDGVPVPQYEDDPELYFHPTTSPGARLPHVWLQRDGKAVSTLDIAGKGRFSIFTGIDGRFWAKAAEESSNVLGFAITVCIIGPGQEITDLYGDWALAREMEEGGCLLVRPDGFVAWRAQKPASNVNEAQRLLLQALRQTLSLQVESEQDATSARSLEVFA